ncbi:hypothetical protein FSHL1_012088 [Fusarium sambucinum]
MEHWPSGNTVKYCTHSNLREILVEWILDLIGSDGTPVRELSIKPLEVSFTTLFWELYIAVTYLLFKTDYHVARLATALLHQPQINVLSNAKKVKDQSISSKWRRGQNSAEPSAFVESHSHLRVYTPTTSITTPIHTFTALPRPGPDLI